MDLKKLLTRSISGLVYCLVIVGCILCEQYGVLALAALLIILACVEFAKISRDLSDKTLPALILDIAGCLSLCVWFFVYPLVIWVAIMTVRFIVELYSGSGRPLKNLAHSMMSQIYIGMPMALMTGIAWIFHPMIILAIFLLLWINDTGAFIVGSMLGRHKLFERVSPKKTWEGFLGGMAFSLAASVLFSMYCSDFFGLGAIRGDTGSWIGLGIVISIFGTWGDLVESMIKRSLGIKDSGHIIPGHGGILDRIDSLLLSLPAASVYFAIIIYLSLPI